MSASDIQVRITVHDPFITTYSGKQVHFLNPRLDEIDIRDIAHGLGNLCRYVGQSDRFYSVAQHSVLIARFLPDELKLEGLLHDATEAYLGDMASPIKKLLPEFKAIESVLDLCIRSKFDIDEDESNLVRIYDMRIRRDEWRVLFPQHKGRELCDFDPRFEPIGFHFQPWEPMKAQAEFLMMYHRLTRSRRNES